MTYVIAFNPNSKDIGCSLIQMINVNFEKFKGNQIEFIKSKLAKTNQYLAMPKNDIFYDIRTNH
jgi:hypothetical protein